MPSLPPDLLAWQGRVHAFRARNAVRAPGRFLILPDRLAGLGTKVER